MASLIDPTVQGRYPVILGEGILGKTSNDIFTRVRYNHKPTLSSGDAPASARLKPSLPGKTGSYDLSFADGGGTYAFAGTRTVDGNQYVLHFDSKREAFILDKIDSTFNMNLTRLPGNSDSDKLGRQYPHLDATQRPGAKKTDTKKGDAKKNAGDSGRPPKKPIAKSPVQSRQPKRKTENKQQKDVELTLPKPEPQKQQPPQPPQQQEQKSKGPKHAEEDEEEDDDDGGLLVEYPGADTAAKVTDFSPAFPPPRRFDDFMDQRDSEGDADGETDDEPDMDFKLPSPVNNHLSRTEPIEEDQGEVTGSADMEDDLEKEMEIAFEDLENSQEGSPNGGDESEISEED